MKNPLAVALLIFGLTGCVATAPKISETASGNPEVVVKTQNIEAIQNLIIDDMVNFKYVIEAQTKNLLRMSRPGQGNEALGAYLKGVGNAYSATERVATYNFISTDAGVRVIAISEIRSRLPGGQVNSASLSGNSNVYNEFQKQLTDIKAKLER